MVHGESQVLLRSKGLGPMGVGSGLKTGPQNEWGRGLQRSAVTEELG